MVRWLMKRSPQARRRPAQVLVIFALLATGFLALIGLALDAGIIFWNKARLQALADSAALAGGLELTNTSEAQFKATEYLALHSARPPTVTVQIGFGYLRVPNDTMTVRLARGVPTTFLRILGFDTVTVTADATVFATLWDIEGQGWPLFRGNEMRTGYVAEDPAFCQQRQLETQAILYDWGFRWNTHDYKKHRSTPAVFRYLGDDTHAPIANGNFVVVVGSNGENGSIPDVYTGVWAWDTETGNLLWFSRMATKVRSSPVVIIDPDVYGGQPVVVVNGHDGKVYALDGRTGGILWSTDNTIDDFEEDGLYRASPAYAADENAIYTATSRGHVYKVDARNGRILWGATITPSLSVDWRMSPNAWRGANVEANWGVSPIYGTPAVDDIPGVGRVVFVADHGGDKWGPSYVPPRIYALRASDGSGLWYSAPMNQGDPTESNNRNSPAVGPVDTDFDGTPDEWRVFGAPTDGYLYAFDAATGATRYQVFTGFKNHRSDLALYCGVVYGGNGDEKGARDGGIFAITAATGFSIWDPVDSDGPGPDLANPYWNSSEYSPDGVRYIPGGVKSAPALVRGLLLVGANWSGDLDTASSLGGSMWALNAFTGEGLGHWDTIDHPAAPPGTQNGDVRSGVIVAPDGKVYFGSMDGGLYQVYVSQLITLIK